MFNSGNKPYARWMLGSTLSVCMSCHSQLPSSSRELKSFTSASNFSDEFSQAEFLFATRAFDKASELFDKIINSYPNQGIKAEQVETALERQVTYYSRIKRNPEEAIKVFSQYEKNEKLPPFVKPSLASWISQFKSWQSGPQIDPQTATDDQIIKFAKDHLEGSSMPLTIAADNPRLVSYLRVSGVLYEFMQSHPKSPAIPQVLYWLSICDRSIDNNFFFSMSDLYLKECMLSYPTDPIAKKCYKEYEDKVILSYSGSAGTNVPDSVRRELSQLRKYVESGGKSKINAN